MAARHGRSCSLALSRLAEAVLPHAQVAALPALIPPHVHALLQGGVQQLADHGLRRRHTGLRSMVLESANRSEQHGLK